MAAELDNSCHNSDLAQSQIWVHNDNRNDRDNSECQHKPSENERDTHEYQDKSSNSEASEIANLADVSISDDIENCTNVLFDETKQQEEVARFIEEAKLISTTSIDLSKRKLKNFPDALAQLPHLEYMYLEGNDIAVLPDAFFKMFPKLRWLDLRNNLLTKIPTAYLATHACLRNLLLEGNNIHHLPLELGLIKSLQGLNIAGNPLDFPPQEIIEQGTKHMLCYLKDLHKMKRFQAPDLELKLSEESPFACEQGSVVSSSDWNTAASMMELAKTREGILKNKVEADENSYDVLPQEDSAKSEKSYVSSKYKKVNHQKSETIKKTSASDILDRKPRKKKKEDKLTWKMNPYPYLPTQEYVAFIMSQEKHIAKVKEQKEKIEAIIQKQKNEAVLRKWRDVTKLLQQKKYSQHLLPGKDYKEPGEQAPFGIDAEMMKVLSKEDRLKADIQREAELKQRRQVSPQTRAIKEQNKTRRILELEQRVNEHTAAMIERRKLPKGTPQHEIEMARRELQIAEQLHSLLFAESRELEYNIKTFPVKSSKRVNYN